jgi:hypothetical protein
MHNRVHPGLAWTQRALGDLCSTPDDSTRSLLNHTTPKSPLWKSSEAWWDSVNGGKALPAPARQYRAPAPWRDISDPLLVTYLHIALKTLGPVHTLNLNLSAEIEKKARAQEYPLGWLHRRISLHLKRALNRPVEFFLVPEECDHHRLHLHGEFQVSEDEAKDARAALRKAGGKWDAEASQRQAWTAFDPDRGWLDYLTLDMWRVGFTRNYLPKVTLRPGRVSNTSITFNGGTVSSTKILNAVAELLYEQQRQLIKPVWRCHD